MGCLAGKPTSRSTLLRFDTATHAGLRHRLEALDFHYDCLSELGTGLSGPVLLARRKLDSSVAAVKGLLKSDFFEGKIMLVGEIKIYLELDHPRIARLVEVLEDDEYCYLVMEHCGGGNLHAALSAQLAKKKKNNPSFAEARVRQYTLQMLQTLAYLEAHNIAHRDLKLENWVFSKPVHEGGELVLVDFGFARRVQGPETVMTRLCGSAPYASPELLRGAYNLKAETWALGVTVYMLLVGYPPYHANANDELFSKICADAPVPMESKRWLTVSDEAKDFVQTLMTKDARRRPSARDALGHPWLRQLAAKPRPRTTAQVAACMRSFTALSGFARLCLSGLACIVSPDMLREHDVCGLFEACSSEHTGKITLEDLTEALAEHHTSPEEAGVIFAAHCSRFRDRLSYSDFVAPLLQPAGLLHFKPKQLQAFFELLTENGKVTETRVTEKLGTMFGGRSVQDLFQEEFGTAKCPAKHVEDLVAGALGGLE